MSNVTCSIDGCARLAKVRGWCGAHYHRWRNYGDPTGGKRPVRPAPVLNPCSIVECDMPVKCRGWCNAHYCRWRVYGDPLGAPPPKPKFCSINGCQGTLRRGGRGWCSQHYQRWRNHGDPLGGKPGPLVRKAVDFPDGTRLCTKCGERLPIDQFPKDRNGSLGRKARCKLCHCAQIMAKYHADPERRTKSRARYQANIERRREKDRERYRRDKPKRIELANEAAHRRRKRLAASERMDAGISALSLRDRDGSKCYICKKTMDFKPGVRGKYKPRRASIEHLIPIHQGGLHVWENVVLTCLSCNLSRPKKGHDPGGDQLLLIG